MLQSDVFLSNKTSSNMLKYIKVFCFYFTGTFIIQKMLITITFNKNIYLN